MEINRKCPRCNNALAISANEQNAATIYALQPMNYENGRYVVHIGQNTEYLPLCVFICTKCGHVEVASAVILGLTNNAEKTL